MDGSGDGNHGCPLWKGPAHRTAMCAGPFMPFPAAEAQGKKLRFCPLENEGVVTGTLHHTGRQSRRE